MAFHTYQAKQLVSMCLMRVGLWQDWHAESQPENKIQKEPSKAQEASQHKADADASNTEGHVKANGLHGEVNAEEQPDRSQPAEPHRLLALSAAEPAALTSPTVGDVAAGHAQADALSIGVTEAGKKGTMKRKSGTASCAEQTAKSGSSAEPVGTSLKKRCKVNSSSSVCCHVMEHHIRQYSIDCISHVLKQMMEVLTVTAISASSLPSWERGPRSHSRVQSGQLSAAATCLCMYCQMMTLLSLVPIQHNTGNSLASPSFDYRYIWSKSSALSCSHLTQGIAKVAKSETWPLSCRLWLSLRQQEVVLPLHLPPQLRKFRDKQVVWLVVIKLVTLTLKRHCAYDPFRYLKAHLHGFMHPMVRRRGTKVHPLRQTLPARGCTCTC